VEGLEAFVEKKVEYNKMIEDMVEFFRMAAHEHRVYAEAKGTAANLPRNADSKSSNVPLKA